MKKSELQQIIKEEIQNLIKENAGLKLGEFYQIYDPGMDEWDSEYEYLGFSLNTREHMFRAFDSPGYFTFIGIPENELKTSVR